MDELNRRLDQPVPADRFRANIIVDGCGPHDEDRWTEITIGEVGFGSPNRARCGVGHHDQKRGARPNPLRTLAGYRSVDGKCSSARTWCTSGPGSCTSATRSASNPNPEHHSDIDELHDSENSY